MEQTEQNKESMKLDYTIEDAATRSSFVAELLLNYPADKKITEKYMEILSSYIVAAMTKEEKKEKKILTDNRMVTINKRETSYQHLTEQFENGEEGVWNITADHNNILLTHKKEITEEDVAAIPPLKSLIAAIELVREGLSKAEGKDKYTLKKQLIEMQQEQYIIKSLFNPAVAAAPKVRSFHHTDFGESITFDESGEPVSDGVLSFFNPVHISAILCNYSALMSDADDHLTSDLFYLMRDFDKVSSLALEEKYPLYYWLMIYKIDGRTNLEIQSLLQDKFNLSYTIEYISSLWRNTIPKIIAATAVEEYLLWYFTFVEKGKWKRCSRCGETKLAHNRFFSKNNTSNDGYYSICKCCRNKKPTQIEGGNENDGSRES